MESGNIIPIQSRDGGDIKISSPVQFSLSPIPRPSSRRKPQSLVFGPALSSTEPPWVKCRRCISVYSRRPKTPIKTWYLLEKTWNFPRHPIGIFRDIKAKALSCPKSALLTGHQRGFHSFPSPHLYWIPFSLTQTDKNDPGCRIQWEHHIVLFPGFTQFLVAA